MFIIADKYVPVLIPKDSANDNSVYALSCSVGVMAMALFEALSLLPDNEAKKILNVISEEIEHRYIEWFL